MFVITTNTNLGDIAYCLEWINELKRESYKYAFVLDRFVKKFVPEEDTLFFFSHDRHVKDTILEALSIFKANTVIFASSSCWNIPGQEGAEWGFWDEDILNLKIPILSFDPFEGLNKTYIHLWNKRIYCPPTPGKILSLRASPNISECHNIRHFRILERFEQLTKYKKHEVLKRVGLDQKKRLYSFPLLKAITMIVEKLSMIIILTLLIFL